MFCIDDNPLFGSIKIIIIIIIIRKKCNIRCYQIHDICIEEVKLTNDFSKETII